MTKRAKKRKRSKARRRLRSAPGRQSSEARGSDYDMQMPNEYFHTVAIQTVWHPNGGVPQDEVVDPEAQDGNILLGGAKHCMQGTGFFYRLNRRNFLITARHCFTGRAWRTNEYLEPPVTPTHLRMRLRLKPKSENFDANQLLSVEFCLRLVDEDCNPLWFEHPRGPQVDVAARPLDDLPIDELHFVPLEPKDAAYGAEPRFWVTDDLYIVGYPFGLDHGFFWPIWIRGTVASEPTLLFTYKEEQYPLFLVDSRTRTGQSGSPVLLPRRHFTEVTDDEEALPRSRLIGVYTGRINPESDLGLAWHIGEVDKMCRAKQNAPKSRS
jgi:Trypsin-like peptidase domain